MDIHTPEQRRRNMQAVRSSGSKAERLFAAALWKKGYRYRKNCKKTFGKPDFTLRRYNIAIFIDSEFFHGRYWEVRKFEIKSNQEFWWNKISGNIRRDNLVTERLTREGWKVLRFWDTDVIKNIALCLEKFERQAKVDVEF